MPAVSRKYLVGLVGPDVLEAAEKDLFHPVRLDLDCCDAIEIRYDFFDESVWDSLSERVRHVVPDKLQIGTIRLKRDGGKFADERVVERMDLWKKILSGKQVPEWLDLERDCLSDFKTLNDMAFPIGVGLIISEHNFERIPNDIELETFADDVKRVGAHWQGQPPLVSEPRSEPHLRFYRPFRSSRTNRSLHYAPGPGSSRKYALRDGNFGLFESVLAFFDIFSFQ